MSPAQALVVITVAAGIAGIITFAVEVKEHGPNVAGFWGLIIASTIWLAACAIAFLVVVWDGVFS